MKSLVTPEPLVLLPTCTYLLALFQSGIGQSDLQGLLLSWTRCSAFFHLPVCLGTVFLTWQRLPERLGTVLLEQILRCSEPFSRFYILLPLWRSPLLWGSGRWGYYHLQTWRYLSSAFNMLLNPFTAQVVWPIRCILCQQWHLVLRDCLWPKVFVWFYTVLSLH